jgi:hypothetical protein
VHAETQIPIHREPGKWTHRFDLLTAFEVLEHINDDLGALAQWRKWIKPHGQLCVSVPAHPELWNPRDVWAGHIRRYSRDQLHERLEEAGYWVSHIECYGFPLANLLEKVAALLQKGEIKGDGSAGRTALSGVERKFETRAWTLFKSCPVTLVMRGFCALQDQFLQTDWGTGYIAIARKTSEAR